MSGWAVAHRAGALLLFAVAMGPSAARASDAASAIAERFASEADRAAVRGEPTQTKRIIRSKSAAAPGRQAQRDAEDARTAAEQRRADEADMLARARREAEERRAAEERAQLAEEARRLIIEAEAARANAEALLQRRRQQAAEKSDRQVPPSNAEASQREAAEAEARRAALEAAERERARAAEEARLAKVHREQTRRLIKNFTRVRQIRSARIAAQERRRALAERQMREARAPSALGGAELGAAPSQRRADRTESADRSETRSVGSVTTAAAPSPLPSAEPTMALGGRDREESALPETYEEDRRDDRFAVLLVMAPGNYGIRRRGPKVADPILCAPDGCFVSRGPDRPARFLRGRKALGFFNTFGRRAGACRRRLGCVFRGVELGRFPDYLQPVDLHILKHDRRSPHEVSGDSHCRTDGKRLVCGRGIYADDYAMWIVPERVAEEAGPDALERAVAEGLSRPRSTDVFSLLGR